MHVAPILVSGLPTLSKDYKTQLNGRHPQVFFIFHWLINELPSNTTACLTFWCRNYFFLILANPVYKM